MMIALAFLLFTLLCLAMGNARSWSDETRAERNALVFHGRNQAYGAYRLRNGYDRRVGLAFLAALGCVALAAGLPKAIAWLLPPADAPRAEQVLLVVDLAPVIELPAGPPMEDPVQAAAPAPPKPAQPAEPQLVEAVDSVVPFAPRDTTLEAGSVLDGGLTAEGGTHGADTAGTSEIGSHGIGSPLGGSVHNSFEVQELPEFPGGEAAMRAWVGRHLQFPEEAQGRDMIYVQFVIGLDGAVEEVKAVKGGQPALKTAAERVVRRMPRWKPARMNGHDVRCRLTLPIRFETR